MAASQGGRDSEPAPHIHRALGCQLGAAVAAGGRETCSSQSKVVREELRPARPFQGAINPTTKLLGPLGVELRGGLPVSKNPASFISRLPHAICNSSLTRTPRTEPEEAQEQA